MGRLYSISYILNPTHRDAIVQASPVKIVDADVEVVHHRFPRFGVVSIGVGEGLESEFSFSVAEQPHLELTLASHFLRPSHNVDQELDGPLVEEAGF